MAQGYLVTCIPSDGKRPKKSKEETDVGSMIRFLRPVRNFIQRYIDPTDTMPIVTVKIFNSNGYLERIVKNKDAVVEFNK